MTISDAAQRNQDALFPNHPSTLKATDPALIEGAPLHARLRLMGH